MFGCRGIAPISVSLCTRAAALAPLAAGVLAAGEAADGAAELPEPVWGWGADSVEVRASGASVGVWVIGTSTSGAEAGAGVITGADMTGDTGLIGLTGDSTLVGFVTDLTHVLDDVTHGPQAGCP